MITNSPDTNRVSFISVNPTTDFILALDSATYGLPGIGVLISTLIPTDAAFWMQSDADGILQLCTTKVFGKHMILTYRSMGVGPIVTTVGHTFVSYEDSEGVVSFGPRV